MLDTNVLLAGIATHGICEGLLAISFRDHSVVLSEHILDEVAKRYGGKFKATSEQASLVVDTLRKQSSIVVPASVPSDAVGDVYDLPVLDTTVAGHVDCLVTGVKRLLGLGSCAGIPILSPREFYDRIRVNE